jgi:8-oxo-dGTP pyrophosphatase MutT (NUDIX family)
MEPMNTILTITHQDFFPDSPRLDTDTFRIREAARAVVVDENGRVALLKVGKHSYHKLPGGGIDEGEDKIEALSREFIEEIGCDANVIAELGAIVELRDKWELKQTSYCYLAKQFGPISEPEFTPEEIADGFSVVWVDSVDIAITLLENDRPTNYEGLFIQKRDLTLLNHALHQL